MNDDPVLAKPTKNHDTVFFAPHPNEDTRPERTFLSSHQQHFNRVTMAPKSKKAGDTIASRLALVMKSGKGM